MCHDRNLVPILDRGSFFRANGEEVKAVHVRLPIKSRDFWDVLTTCTTFVTYHSAARIGQRLDLGSLVPSRIINVIEQVTQRVSYDRQDPI